MKQCWWMGLSLVFWVVMSGVGFGATSPAQIVQSFIDAHRQGRFAEASGLAIEQVDASRSLFSSWLFRSSGVASTGVSADVFLSRKFTDVFQYRLIDTQTNGDNQAFVTAIRTSPSLGHLYTWALAPLQGRPPYELVEAVDTYLTKVNYPVEDSRMEFTLIREANDWYISAIRDERMTQLQAQVAGQPAVSTSDASVPRSAVPSTGAVTSAAASTQDAGRQSSDAQFNATLNHLNQAPSPSATVPSAEAEKPSALTKFKKLFTGKKESQIVARLSEGELNRTFKNIRNAIASYALENSAVPDSATVYDWASLRELVNVYSRAPLPATEEIAGFSFVDYSPAGIDDYILLVKLQRPENGLAQVEVTPYGVDRVN